MTMERVLPASVYFGEPSRGLSSAGFSFSERAYAPSVRLPRHSHERACLCFVLAGGYEERHGARRRDCAAGDLVSHPAGEAHSDRHGDAPVRLLCIDVEAERLEALRGTSFLLDAPAELHRGTAAWLGARLYRELVNADAFSALAMEGIALEMLAAASRGGKPHARPPTWLARAEELLRDGYRRGLQSEEIAAAVGVHPVHLARAFRRHYRCSPGEFVRTLRIEDACRRLARGQEPLAEVALETGFADQSHLARAFRSQVGMTPGEYRRALAAS